MAKVENESKFLIFVDHENVPTNTFSIENLLRTWVPLLQLGSEFPAVADVVIRAYGGWFEGVVSSPARFSAAEYYQKMPAVVRLAERYFRVTFAFADTLVETVATKRPQEVRITHSVAFRTTKKELTFSKASFVCTTKGCEIDPVRRWSRNSRACLRGDCPHEFSALFHRKQQKQVDVHLAVDLLLVVEEAKALGEAHAYIAVVSDDADLLPAIAGAVRLSQDPSRIACVRSNKGTYLDSELARSGVLVLSL